jgi:hypothetical protein
VRNLRALSVSPPPSPHITRGRPAISYFDELTEKRLPMPLFANMLEITFRDCGHRVLGPVKILKAATFLAATKRIDINDEYPQR